MEISGSIYIILTALCWSFGGLFLKFVTGNVIAVAGISKHCRYATIPCIPWWKCRHDSGTGSGNTTRRP